MGKAITIFILLIAIIFAAGCKGGVHGGVYIEDDHSHAYEAPSPEEYYPWLIDFNIIDSYGEDSINHYFYTAELDPYVDEGLFEVYWDVDSTRDYIVEYRVNDIPEVLGSTLIDAELCGVGLYCDETGFQFCQYNTDFTMSCDVAFPAYADVNSTYAPVDINHLVTELPEPLYLVIQICDTESNYCEFEAKAILVY